MIPLVLKIECDDIQTLDVIATPEAFPVKLKRSVFYAHRPGGSVFHDKKGYVNNILALNSVYAIAEINTHVGSANWWQPPPGQERPSENARILHGEIPVLSDLVPAGDLVRYRLFVSSPSSV